MGLFLFQITSLQWKQRQERTQRDETGFGWVFACAAPKMCWRSCSASTERLLVKKVACLRSFNKYKNQNHLLDLDLSLWVICRWIMLCLRTELIIHMSKMSRACFKVIQVSCHYRTTLKLPEPRQQKTLDKLTPKILLQTPLCLPQLCKLVWHCTGSEQSLTSKQGLSLETTAGH